MLALNTSAFLPPSPQSMETDNTRQTMSPASKRFCSQTLSKLLKNRHSVYFRLPVDPVALKCPDYFDIIKHPMDLSTVETKLYNDEYDSVDAFVDDVRLIFDNCHKYNNPADKVAVSGRKMEEAFNELLQKRPSITYPGAAEPTEIMPEDQQRRCEDALEEMKKRKHEAYNWPFMNPVDAVAWGATDYYDIIKKPMDLSTLQRNLDEYQYANEEDFAADVRIMFQNCYTYNNPQHAVYNHGKSLEKVFNAFWAKEHSSSSTSKAKKSKKSSSSSKSKHVAKPPGKVKEEDATVSQKRTSEHLDDRDDSSNKKKSGPANVLRLKLTQTNKNNNESNDLGKQNEEQVSPRTPSSSSSLASSTTPALSSHPRSLAISKEPPPALSSSSSSQPRPLALSATKPAAATNKQSSASTLPPSFLSTQRRPSDDNNRQISIPDARKREQSNEASKYPAGKYPAGKHPASKHPATKHPPGKFPAGKHPKQASQQQTTPVSPPPARMLDFDSLLDTISNENKLREQERKEQLRANEEKQRTAKQLEMRRLQEEERAQKEWQERTSRQKKYDRQRREAELNATTIDISKHKLTFYAFEKQLGADPDWQDLLRWHHNTVDYRHIPRPGFVKRHPGKTVADVKASLLNRVLRYRSQQNGAQERDEGEQDMDVE